MLAAESTRQEPEQTGLAPAPGGRLWWRLDGARHLRTDRPVLIAAHGGPGGSHDYLEPLTGLTDERAVLLYDQLDCGNSDRPGDKRNWNVERFTAEIDALRSALGIRRFILLGHSWGAVIALEYAARGNPDLAGVVFASPLISTARWVADNLEHRRALPLDVQDVLDRHEAAGTVESPEYRTALAVMMGRHFCRLKQEPAEIQRLFRKLNADLYKTLWGDNEFVCTGTLKDYEGAVLLPQIAVPALFLCGEFDESTPDANRDFAALVPGAKVSIIPGASHTPMFENPVAFLTALRWFCGDL
jgi:proline iminopeptidase